MRGDDDDDDDVNQDLGAASSVKREPTGGKISQELLSFGKTIPTIMLFIPTNGRNPVTARAECGSS